MKKILACIGIFSLIIPATAMAIDIGNVQIGGQVRMRGYNLQNVWDFNDDNDADNWSVFRHKTSLSMKMDVGDNVTGYIQITNQNYGEGDSVADDNRSNKIFVDNSFIEVKSLWGAPISLKMGRQNLIYGSGFVLYDGQSQFASTSIYLDGIKATAQFSDNIWLDALYFKDQENTRSNEVDDDITLGGFYFTAQKNVFGTQEVYLLNRDDQSLKKNIYMLGARLSDKFEIGIDYSVEAAMQAGDFSATVDQDALGYKLDLGYTFGGIMKPRIFCGYAFLGGDDRGTVDDNERWDVFYGGWPQFGDLLAWQYINTGADNAITNYDSTYNAGSSTAGEAVFSNFSILTLGAQAKVGESVFLKASYSLMKADEVDAGADDDIGSVYQLTAGYKYNKSLGFRLYAATMDPGKAFVNDDNSSEVFVETDLRF